MLAGLEPSISLTGGPWYTDNELDTEFIKHLMDACYKLISDIVSSCHLLFEIGPHISLILTSRAFQNVEMVRKEYFIQYQTLLNTLPLKASGIL